MNAAEKEVFSSIFTKHVSGHILRGAFGAIFAKNIPQQNSCKQTNNNKLPAVN